MHENGILIALGSSLGGRFGSPEAVLDAAMEHLSNAGLKPIVRSSFWRSASWPDPSLPDYINAVVIVETALDPAQTLARLHTIEAAFGRDRGAGDAPRNAPRVLDLDLIAHGRAVIDTPGLTLPHPRAHERLFVMGPLAQIASDWRHPVLGRTAAELAMGATVGRDTRPI